MFPHMKNDDSLCPYKRLLVLHIKNIHFDRTNKYFRHVGGFDAWSGFKKPQIRFHFYSFLTLQHLFSISFVIPNYRHTRQIIQSISILCPK